MPALTEYNEPRIGRYAAAVTPGPGALARQAYRLICSGAGTATVTLATGGSVTIGLAAGIPLDLEITHVTAATATGIVAIS